MGNKKKLISKGLVDIFPKDIQYFVDVFAGSSIVAMNVKAKNYIVNDKDIHLIELYNLFKKYSSKTIIEWIESRIEEYGLAKERTKRNQFCNTEKLNKYKTAYMNFRQYYNETKLDLDFYTLMFYSFHNNFGSIIRVILTCLAEMIVSQKRINNIYTMELISLLI